MDCVIVNKEGELYGGFEDGKPVWFKTKRPGVEMDEKTADTVLRQMTQLGFEDIAIRDANDIKRKWVPKALDVSKVPA